MSFKRKFKRGKTIVVTNRDLFNAQRALNDVLARRPNPQDALAFARLIKPIRAAMNEINEHHERVLSYHHATLTPDGRQYVFTDEARPKFYAEWDAYMNEEISVKFAPIPDEWIEKLGMNAGEVTALLFLFIGE
jgi:hypothetical protein